MVQWVTLGPLSAAIMPPALRMWNLYVLCLLVWVFSGHFIRIFQKHALMRKRILKLPIACDCVHDCMPCDGQAFDLGIFCLVCPKPPEIHSRFLWQCIAYVVTEERWIIKPLPLFVSASDTIMDNSWMYLPWNPKQSKWNGKAGYHYL